MLRDNWRAITSIDKGADQLFGALVQSTGRVNIEMGGSGFVLPWRERYLENDKSLLLLALTKILVKDKDPYCACSKYFQAEKKIQMATTLVNPIDKQKLKAICSLDSRRQRGEEMINLFREDYKELLASAIIKSKSSLSNNKGREEKGCSEIRGLLTIEKEAEVLNQLLTNFNEFYELWEAAKDKKKASQQRIDLALAKSLQSYLAYYLLIKEIAQKRQRRREQIGEKEEVLLLPLLHLYDVIYLISKLDSPE